MRENASDSRSPSRRISQRILRDVVGVFATGVTIVTTRSPGPAYGVTASSFTSVSLDPPLVLVCTKRDSEGCRWIRENGHFAVNILGCGQEDLSNFFASHDRPRDSVAFQHLPYRRLESGSPILQGVAAYLDCKLAASHDAGDHVILIGEVLALDTDPKIQPLLFYRGSYCRLQEDVAPGSNNAR